MDFGPGGHFLNLLAVWRVNGGAHRILVAPYCAIPRDYLSDTLLLRAMGFLVSQHGQLGAILPPPFLSVSPLESMRSGGAMPPPEKGYLSDTCAMPYENKANGCDTPLCDTISKGYCKRYGGVSRTGPLSKPILSRGCSRGKGHAGSDAQPSPETLSSPRAPNQELASDHLARRPALNLIPEASFVVRKGGWILGVDFCGPCETS